MSQKQQFFGVILARKSEKILNTCHKLGQDIVDKLTKVNNINLPLVYFRADIL